MKINFILSLCLLFLYSCEALYFDEPQPIDAKSEKKFPKELRGKWVNDSIPDFYLVIDKSSVTSMETLRDSITKDSIGIEAKEAVKLSEKTHLRAVKQGYFLSQQDSITDPYSIQYLALSKDTLRVTAINIQRFRSIIGDPQPETSDDWENSVTIVQDNEYYSDTNYTQQDWNRFIEQGVFEDFLIFVRE